MTDRKPPETVGCLIPDNEWASMKVYTKPGTARGVNKNHSTKKGKVYIGTVKWVLDGTQTPETDEKKGMELLTDAINADFGDKAEALYPGIKQEVIDLMSKLSGV